MELSGAAVYYFDPDVSGEISIVDLIPYLGSALKKDDVGAAYKAEMTDLASVAAAEVADATDFETALIIQHGDAVTCAITSSGYGSMLQLLELENIVPNGLPGSDSASFVTSAMMALNTDALEVTYSWLLGSLSGRTWSAVNTILPYSIVGLCRDHMVHLSGESD